MTVPLEGHVPIPADRAEHYRRAGHWTGLGLADTVLGLPGDGRDGSVALVDCDRRVTYGELRTSTGRLAARLHALGLRHQDRVVVQLPNGVPFVTLILALWRLGSIPVLALPAHGEHELRYLLEMSDASALAVPASLHRSDHLAVVRRLIPGRSLLLVQGEADLRPGEVDLEAAISAPWGGEAGEGPSGDDVALLLLSGGTTGLPKLIPRTHDDYGCNLRVSAALCGLHEGSVYLASLPAAHNFALGCPGVMGTLARGGRVVLGPPALDVMVRERVTVTAAVPSLAARWAEAVDAGVPRPRDLRLLQVGGARLAPAAARSLRIALRCGLQQVYGMAEGLLCFTRLDDAEEVVETTQGRPASPDDEIRIVDGELWVRGPYTIAGYFRAPDANRAAFTEDGFYRTGDLVARHPSGNLVVHGRIKDVINRDGEKIAAAEVEDLALGHEGVAQAAAVAMPDPASGEAVCLYAVPRGRAVLTLEGIRSFLRARGLARYKLPDRLEVVADLPLTAVGKVDKARLRKRLAGMVGG
ncbi:MAG TPA: AMP-binding protein [Terriglobales bacterium]|nr:AMP-binding protein [Terriglobales bacterium]